MLRLLGILVTVAFAIATAILTWPGFFRLEQVFPVAQVAALRGVVVVAFAIVTVVFLLFAVIRPLRGFALSMALVSAIGAISGGVILGARGYGTGSLPDSTETSVRVMTWNTAGNAMGADEIAQTAVAMDVDIVALPETAASVGEDVAVAMRDLDRPMWVHHVALQPELQDGPQAWQTTLLISPDLGDYSVIEASSDLTSNTEVVPSVVAMPVDGEGPIVVAVHAVAPQPEYMSEWVDDLRWVADQCVDGNVILAGDFNATLDHMTSLGADGFDLGYCDDAAAATGNGAVGTWPTDLPALLSTPIDHVMHSAAWRATGSIVLTNLDGAGSDHRPLVVQLEPAG
ncbi:endonuclease/exonuclease/phosphatase family protein [Microbacterium betulae]|uniref:Endonuclease/exonuclease/phosphatase family protein n=1 Tax=Microbacterium betulae TaxID=2981139 RepID=A0AA97I648_9MICO|nr:endonuclease/exonuclease/phosphatase family protein [Microbacterium sp. AB]WOF24451.1 endonuclease/exonuclease/phosphatase family protein [Microbacterium sp. AB]